MLCKRLAGLAAVLALLGLLTGGCGSSGKSETVNGRKFDSTKAIAAALYAEILRSLPLQRAGADGYFGARSPVLPCRAERCRGGRCLEHLCE
jgi:hypothetical protein